MTTPPNEWEKKLARVAVLLADYEHARDDNRQFNATQTAVVALAMTAISLLGALAFSIRTNTEVPDPVLAAAPLIALVPLVMIYHIGAVAVMRSFYLRALERTIRAEFGGWPSMSGYRNLAPLSYEELSLAVEGLGPGSARARLSSLHVMVVVIFPAVVVVFGGMAGYLASVVAPVWGLLMVPFYGAAGVALLVGTVRMNLGGRANFEQYVDIQRRRLEGSLYAESPAPAVQPNEGRRRSALSYFVIPRPDDLIKGVFLGAGVLAAVLSSRHAGFAGAHMVPVLGLWFATEFLLYQARYQWNDIIGRHEDREAPVSVARGRLPEFPGDVHVSWIVILVKVYLVVVMTHIVWSPKAGDVEFSRAVHVALATYILLAVVYEVVRWLIRRAGSCSRLQLVSLLGVVGLGYPARFMVGWTAFGGGLDQVGVVLALAFWGIGISFVSLTWILEGASYFYVSNDILCARMAGRDIAMKPHLEELLKMVGVRIPSEVRGEEDEDASRSGRNFKILRVLPQRFSPWNFGSAVWFLSAGTVCLSIAGISDEMNYTLIVGMIIAAALVFVPASGRLTWRLQVVAAILSLVFLTVALWSIRTQLDLSESAWMIFLRLAVLLLVMTVPMLVYVSFRGQSYAASREMMAKIGWFLLGAARRFYGILCGDSRQG